MDMDIDEDSFDSGVDTNFSSDFESITSSNYQFRQDGDRRYHGIEGNSYPLPNDEDEVSRLDDLHFVYRVILGDNIVAPITRTPTDILDVGTGSGRWPIEVADRFPDCHVTGMDISPVNPIYEIPENCYFIVEDLTNGLLFNTGSMDLVHSRIVMAGMRKDQWPGYMSEVYRVLKPGTGWAQCTEFQGHRFIAEGNVPEDAPIRRFDRYLDEWIADVDIYVTGDHLEQHFKDAGFIDIKVRSFKLDIGNWRARGEKGNSLAFNNLTSGSSLEEVRNRALNVFRGALMALCDTFKRQIPNADDRKKFAEEVKADLENPDYCFYSISYTVIGRKPEVPLISGKSNRRRG